MIELKFGVPSQRARKTEKYPETAVVTMLAYKGKGTSKKFEFNKKAEEVLGLTEGACIAVSYNEGKVLFVNATGQDIESYKLTKNSPKTFSNAKVHDYTKTFLGVDDSVDNEFKLEDIGAEYNNYPVFSLANIADTTQEDESNLAESDLKDELEMLKDPTAISEDQTDVTAEIAASLIYETNGQSN